MQIYKKILKFGAQDFVSVSSFFLLYVAIFFYFVLRQAQDDKIKKGFPLPRARRRLVRATIQGSKFYQYAKKMKDYLNINKKAWNNKTEVHIASDFYDNDRFLEGKSTLNSIELELLGDIKGKSILHLQCHFGQDTMTFSRMGAKATGVDFSETAIARAKEFNMQLGLDASFVCCDIYDLPNQLTEKFDIVFTSYGTIGWLPDLDKWAKVVSIFLKPDGKFVMADFHPVVWMYDNDFREVFYSYFNIEPIIEQETGTYADQDSEIETTSVGWNHPISDILNSLISNGLSISNFNEYDYSPYNCLNEMEEFALNKFRIKHFGNKIPMVYAIEASKK